MPLTVLGRVFVAGFVMATIGLGNAASAETVLKVVHGLPVSVDQSKSFQEVFVPKVNEAGKGVIQIEVLGGPEVTPPARQPAALERGIIEVLHGPVTYFGGTISEAFGMLASNLTIAEIRENGGFEMLSEKFAEHFNAKLLAWGEADTQYHIFLTKEPTFEQDNVRLDGFRMRSTSTYAPFFEALGATPINMPASDLATAMDRGLVEGFGWTDTGLIPLGVGDVAKYRIDPGYYRSAVITLINLDTWNALTPEAQDILLQAALDYEEDSRHYMAEQYERELAEMEQRGMEVIELEGEARLNYLRTAYDALWERAKERADVEVLQPKLFDPDLLE